MVLPKAPQARCVHQTRFDLIHVQSRRMIPAGMWLAEQLGVPFIVTVHDFLQPREQLRFDQLLGKRIICVSDTVKSDLLNRTDLPEELFTVIRSGVEVPPEQHLHSVLEPGHVPVVGTAGPLESLKGLPFFLGAAQKILASSHDVEFLVAGTGPEERNLRRLARELGIADHVTFISKLYDFSPSLSAIDIFCQPSLRQGLGTIMLEAMALGKPVIATGVDELYRLVHDGVNGLVVPPSDSSQLALKIVELLNDPIRARSLGQAGRKMVLEEFGVASMIDQTVRLYHEVLADAPVAAEA